MGAKPSVLNSMWVMLHRLENLGAATEKAGDLLTWSSWCCWRVMPLMEGCMRMLICYQTKKLYNQSLTMHNWCWLLCEKRFTGQRSLRNKNKGGFEPNCHLLRDKVKYLACCSVFVLHQPKVRWEQYERVCFGRTCTQKSVKRAWYSAGRI